MEVRHAEHRDQPVGRARRRIAAPVVGKQVGGSRAGDFGDAIGEPRLGDGPVPHLVVGCEEDRRFVLGAADHDRHVVQQRRRCGIEGLAGQHAAVDHRPEIVAVEQRWRGRGTSPALAHCLLQARQRQRLQRVELVGPQAECFSTASASRVVRSRSAKRTLAPLCMIALWNSPWAPGIASSALTFPPPPDWPKIVTLPGSPPKRPACSRTHSSAATRSSTPALPERRSDRRRPAKIEMAEDVQAMVDGHDHDIVALREPGAVVARRVGRAVGEGAACSQTITGRLRCRGRASRHAASGIPRRPAACRRSPDRRQLRPLRGGRRLRRAAGIDGRLAHAGPWLGLARRHEAVGAAVEAPYGMPLKTWTSSDVTPSTRPEAVSTTGESGRERSVASKCRYHRPWCFSRFCGLEPARAAGRRQRRDPLSGAQRTISARSGHERALGRFAAPPG